MSWSTLSEDVWKHILLHVSFAQRLESCSRVNKTLYRAAAASTSQIELYLGEAGVQRLPGLCQWMLRHGQHLTSLRLGAYDAQYVEALTQLPCPNLRKLDLADLRVQLSGSSTQPGVLHICTRLTKLLLYYCPLTDGHSSLAALSALVALQHLELTIGDVVSGSTDDSFMPSTVTQHVTLLTRISLRNAGRLLGTDSLRHVSCLVNLQELRLELHKSNSIPLNPNTTPGLSRLTALLRFCLERGAIDPSILQDCTQLQALQLDLVTISSAGGAAALHSLLGRLQQLQTLQLFEIVCDWPVAAAGYSSLTASSHLQRLLLHIDNLPPGIWPHVFPPGRRLPALRELVACRHDVDAPYPPPPAALGTDDISHLVSCCRVLPRIVIDVQPGAQLAALAKVLILTHLTLSELHKDSINSLRALSGSVNLEKLRIFLGGPIAPQDLLRFTALTQLTELRVNPVTAPEFEGEDDVDIRFIQDCYSDTPVWLQLVEHCGHFRKCQPLIFDSMGRQLMEQKQQIADMQLQQEQLTAQQQQIVQLQVQLATNEAQAAAAACAAAAAAAAVQLEHMQALEGQVLQLLQALKHPEG